MNIRAFILTIGLCFLSLPTHALTKTELIEQVAVRADLNQTQAADAVDAVFAEISASLIEGERVTLADFGAFSIGQRKARIGRNPRTGENVAIPASRKVLFKPSKTLKQALTSQMDNQKETPDHALPPNPVPASEAFLMPIEDVFSIEGRDTIVTGRIERGTLKLGDTIEIVGLSDTFLTTVTGIEMFRTMHDEASVGANVGVLLEGITKDGVKRGQVLSQPGSIDAHNAFTAEIYLLTKEDGGRHTPLFNGYRPQFYFRSTDTAGVVELPEDTELVMPGSIVTMDIELSAYIAMEPGTSFALREGGRTIGKGIVLATD